MLHKNRLHVPYLLFVLFVSAFFMGSCTSSSSPLSLDAEIYPAPLVGSEVTLHIEMLAKGQDLPNTTLTVELPEGIELIDGETTWQGDLVSDNIISFDLIIKVREAGEWVIATYAFSDLGNGNGFGNGRELYVTSTLNSAVVEDDVDRSMTAPPVMQIDESALTKTQNTHTPTPVFP